MSWYPVITASSYKVEFVLMSLINYVTHQYINTAQNKLWWAGSAISDCYFSCLAILIVWNVTQDCWWMWHKTACIDQKLLFPDLFVKVEVKTEHDIDVHLDRPDPNDSEASFFKRHLHEGFCQCLYMLFQTFLWCTLLWRKKNNVFISLLSEMTTMGDQLLKHPLSHSSFGEIK